MSIFGNNEIPWVRGLRALAVIALSAAAVAAANYLNGGDFMVPAGWSWAPPLISSLLLMADKWLRQNVK